MSADTGTGEDHAIPNARKIWIYLYKGKPNAPCWHCNGKAGDLKRKTVNLRYAEQFRTLLLHNTSFFFNFPILGIWKFFFLIKFWRHFKPHWNNHRILLLWKLSYIKNKLISDERSANLTGIILINTKNDPINEIFVRIDAKHSDIDCNFDTSGSEQPSTSSPQYFKFVVGKVVLQVKFSYSVLLDCI